MPRLKAINFDLIRSGNKKEINRMMEDLCRLRPRGASQRLKDKDYVDTHHWETHYRYRLNGNVGESPNAAPGCFGYTDREMYDLYVAVGGNGKYVNDWTIRRWVEFEMNYYKGAATRRTKRIAMRMNRPVKRTVGDTTDPLKVFSVQARQRRDYKSIAAVNYNPLVHIRARSEEEAVEVFNVMFSHTWPETGDYYDRSADFVKMGDEAATVAPNQECINELRRKLADMKAAQAFLEEEMMRLEMGIESLETFNISQFSE